MTRPTYAIRLLTNALKIERAYERELKRRIGLAIGRYVGGPGSNATGLRFARRRIAHLEAAIATLEGK